MKPALKSLISPEIPDGVSLPDTPEDCFILLEAEIGDEQAPGADVFTFYVTTPVYLERTSTDPEQRGLIVLDRFDWAAAKHKIIQICAKAEAATWDECVRLIDADWEFDNYQEYTPYNKT